MDAVPAFQRRRHVDDPSDQLGTERVVGRRVDPVKLLTGHVVARGQLIPVARAPAAHAWGREAIGNATGTDVIDVG